MSVLRNSLPAVLFFLLGSLLAWYLVPVDNLYLQNTDTRIVAYP